MNSKTAVQIFVPCFIDQLFPQTAVNMVQILRQANCEVQYNPKQTCCGQPAFNAGFWEEAKAVSEKFIGDFSADNLPIICPSASCTGFVRNFIEDMDLGKGALSLAYEQLRSRIFELSDFLVNHLNYIDFGARLVAKATYHDACAALRECKIREEPRRLLEKVEGLELIEMKDSDQCCGFGGTFSVKFEPISVAMAEKKVENALAVGAEYIISTDLSCLMQLEGYIQQKKLPIKTLHIADVLARREG